MELETFVIAVAPPSVRTNISASLHDIQTSPQQFFAGSDIVWMLISCGLVFLMVPAMCLFYSGASNRQRSLTLFRLPLITAAVVGFQWYLWGYSLAFTPAVAPPSPRVSWYGGLSRGNALNDALGRPTGADKGPQIPELLYQFYEGMFASFTAALVCGGMVRDVSVGRFLIFITFWSLIVYNPVARWSWHWAGWSNQYGVMDFAGGTAVHITSGTTVLAFHLFYELDTKGFSHCWKSFRKILLRRLKSPFVSMGIIRDTRKAPLPDIIRPGMNDFEDLELIDLPDGQGDNRHNLPDPLEDPEVAPVSRLVGQPGHGSGEEADEPPYNMNNMVLGTALLWFGWFGFNGGSALGGNLRAVSACVSTHVAACAGGTTSLLWFWTRNAFARAGAEEGDEEHTAPSVTHFCDGAVIGLVAITPAAGYVPVWSAGIFGFVAAIAVFSLKQFTREMLKDEPLYVFAIHAGGGFVGMFLTAFFADSNVVGLDGYSTIPDRTKALRLGYQMLDASMGLLYSLVSTVVILFALKVVRSAFKRRWVPLFEKTGHERKWRFEATPQHILRKTS